MLNLNSKNGFNFRKSHYNHACTKQSKLVLINFKYSINTA